MSVTRVAADALHLAAAATWAGLLIAAILVVVPLLRAGGAAATAGRLMLRGYAMPATACVTVIVVTGVYLASGVVGSVDAAIWTFYGRALLLKVALFAVAGSLGLVNTLRLRRRRGADGVGRTVMAEGVVAVLVLAMAAILTSSQPAREPRFVSVATTSAVPVVDGAAADLQESLSIRPNRPGNNVIIIDVFDTRRPSPAPVRGVTVTIVGLDGSRTAALPAQALPDGQWSLNTTLSAPGRTRVEVDVERPGIPNVSRSFSWTIAGAPAATRPATVSTAPLGGALRFAAIVLAVCCLSAWVIAVTGRRTPSARRLGLPEQRHTERESGSRRGTDGDGGQEETDKAPSKVITR
jgi:copper transport protein